jgi:hypothetical protein
LGLEPATFRLVAQCYRVTLAKGSSAGFRPTQSDTKTIQPFISANTGPTYIYSTELNGKLWPTFKFYRWPSYGVTTMNTRIIQIHRLRKNVANCDRWQTYKSGQLHRFHCSYKTALSSLQIINSYTCVSAECKTKKFQTTFKKLSPAVFLFLLNSFPPQTNRNSWCGEQVLSLPHRMQETSRGMCKELRGITEFKAPSQLPSLRTPHAGGAELETYGPQFERCISFNARLQLSAVSRDTTSNPSV